jgi:hypothetical protein
MVAPIQSNGVSYGARPGGDGARSAVALQAQVARCEKQLGDWESCASGKTPEGRRIIDNLRARLTTLQSQLASTGEAPPPEAPTAIATAKEAEKAAEKAVAKAKETATAASTPKTIGGLLSVYA